MKTLSIPFTRSSTAAALVWFITMGGAPAAESEAGLARADLGNLERQFRELPPEARRLTGPLF